MSASVPPPSGSTGGGAAAIHPSDARAFAGRVDAVQQGITEAHEALQRLGDEPLAVGSGQDNRAIAGWYRQLLVADTVPAARAIAAELDHLRQAVRDGAAAWEHTDRGAAGTFRPDAGPG